MIADFGPPLSDDEVVTGAPKLLPRQRIDPHPWNLLAQGSFRNLAHSSFWRLRRRLEVVCV